MWKKNSVGVKPVKKLLATKPECMYVCVFLYMYEFKKNVLSNESFRGIENGFFPQGDFRNSHKRFFAGKILRKNNKKG